MRLFSEDEKLGDRFATVLKRRGGTLALSILSQMEFSGLTDVSQAHAADGFLESVLPNVFFMDFNAMSVIHREEDPTWMERHGTPEADLDLLWLFCALPRPALDRFSAKGFFSEPTRGRDKLLESFSTLADQVLLAISLLHKRIEEEPEIRARAAKPWEGAERPRATLALFRALTGTPPQSQSQKLKKNDAIDLLHTVVAAAYCDYILLDRSWCHRLDVARRQLGAGGISAPIAKAFSKAKVQSFLDELESSPRYI
jgi:hypothetical protein